MAYTDAATAPVRNTGLVKIHGPDAFEGMRRAGRLAAETLDMLTPHVVPGVTTGRLDDLAREFILGHGALAAPFQYRGFPKSICTSSTMSSATASPATRC